MDENEKIAFWSTLGRGLWGAAKTVGKGLWGAGSTAARTMSGLPFLNPVSPTGSQTLNRGIATLLPIGMTAYSLMPTLSEAGMKFSHAAPSTGSATLDRLAKLAAFDHMSPSDAIDAAAYAAFLGSKFVDPAKDPRLHAALDAAGLLGLAGTTAYGMAKSPGEYKPGVKDLAGLALMGSALYDRTKAH